MPVFKFGEIEVNYKLVREGAKVPVYSSDGACCCDFFACMGYAVHCLKAGKTKEIPLGICLEVPPGYVLRLEGRSSLEIRHEVIVLGGVIDCDYRGELSVHLKNIGDSDYDILDGDRVCQGMFIQVARANFAQVDEFSKTTRGEGRYGSTGR